MLIFLLLEMMDSNNSPTSFKTLSQKSRCPEPKWLNPTRETSVSIYLYHIPNMRIAMPFIYMSTQLFQKNDTI